MRHLKGHIIDTFPVKDLYKVDDLIYFDGPLLSFYTSEIGANYLFYWVDVDEECNRWIVFRTEMTQLNEFLNKKMSLFSLFERAINGYVIDVNNNLEYQNIILLQLSDLPKDYSPAKNSYYNFTKTSSEVLIHYFSMKYGKGILQTHFSDGDDIGYGSINLNLFSQLMNHFSEINEGLGNSFYKYEKGKQDLRRKKYKDKKDFNEKPINKIEFKNTYRFEVITSVAASFSMLFKPVDVEFDFEGVQTRADKYMEFFTGFLTDSESVDMLTDYAKNLDISMINQYESFLKLVDEHHCKFQVNYLNSVSKIEYSKEIDSKKAKQIIQNLQVLDFDNDETLTFEGKFVSMNIKQKTYSFESTDEKSSGSLKGDAIKKSIEVAFNKIYRVEIQRKTIKRAAGKKMKNIDYLLSINELDDSQQKLEDI